MAIATMKKLSVLSQKDQQYSLIQLLQGLQNTEIIDLSQYDHSDLADYFTHSSNQELIAKLNQKIKQIEEAITFLDQYQVSLNFWQKLTHKREVFTLSQLEASIEQVDYDELVNQTLANKKRLADMACERSDLESQEAFLRRWLKLEIRPQDTGQFHLFKIAIGSIETQRQEAFEEAVHQIEGAHLDELYYSADQINYMITVAKSNQEQLDEVLRDYAFQPLSYPYNLLPEEELVKNKEATQSLLAERQSLIDRLESDDLTIRFLKLAKEYHYALMERHKAQELIAQSDNLSLLTGWIPESELDDTRSLLADRYSGAVAVFTDEVEPEEIEQVPVKLENAAIVQPFEILTEQYGLPHYSGLDPTPYFYPFHIVFFGFMSADLGYGLLLWLGTFIPLKLADLNPATRKNLRMFNQMALGTMAFGLMFGSFFGFNLPFKVIDLTGQVINVLILSIVLGIIHLLLALVLKVYLSYRDKDYASLYLDGLQWILILLGVVIYGVNMAFINQAWLSQLAVGLILANIVGMFLVNILASENKFAGLGKGLFGLMDLASYLGDVVSYSRLMALALSGANIGMAFNLIISLFPPVARFSIGILLFIALHALNIFITYLGAYVHGMRLEYVEFFGKFYEAGGHPFKPMAPLQEYIWIAKEKRE
ncbi:V-type ATP synthase subunit I [Hutsoniella sourekii]